MSRPHSFPIRCVSAKMPELELSFAPELSNTEGIMRHLPTLQTRRVVLL